MSSAKVICVVVATALGAGTARSQEHGHAPGAAPAMTGPLGVPQAQWASGTAWQPASTPMYGHMIHAGPWMLMFHYLAFAGLDLQGSDRGDTEAFTTNWAMAMAQRPWLGGQLTARAMLSLEPLALGSDGYALLLQTGETSGGEPLVDRQHPHDLFMELAFAYTRELGAGLALELYAAPAGEPALGPPGFPHRLSAHADALAPLSHHWQDSTHILFGVVTAGVYTRNVKLEASWFNGREPDEGRYDLDLRVPDSYAGRLSLNPADEWSGQLSYGYLREPELVLAPGEDLHRITPSIAHDRDLGGTDHWATTLAWGQNHGEHGSSDAVLVESTLVLGSDSFFGRAEYVARSGHDFALEGPVEDETFDVGAVVIGYVRDFSPRRGVVPGLGLRLAVNRVPSELAPDYGGRFPVGAAIYVRLWPGVIDVSPPALALEPVTLRDSSPAAPRARP